MVDQSDRDRATLLDILRACRLPCQFIEGLDRDTFLDDLKTQAAVLHEIMIVGEAVRRLSEGVQTANPALPWRQIAGMRNRLIHRYETVDLEEVWRTATSDIPKLIAQIEPLVDRLQPTNDDAS